MRHDVRHVEKERTFLVSRDEGDGAFGESARELRLVGIQFDHPGALVEWQRRHVFDAWMILAVVVGVGNAEKFIETMPERIELGP